MPLDFLPDMIGPTDTSRFDRETYEAKENGLILIHRQDTRLWKPLQLFMPHYVFVFGPWRVG